MKPYKILIIEDDPVIQGEMETLLRGNGYTAVSVKDFSNVTDTFKAEEPHLILLDIKLPNESGFSICSKIRSISNVPIIFVTSCNTDMDELNSIIAIDLNISDRYMRNLEKGEKVPSVDLFVELRERFGSSLDYIVLGVSASQREQELQDQLQMLRKELKEMQRRILVMLEMLGESA